MSEKVIPYKNSTESKKEQVATMFNNIAPKYDFLNQLLSLGIHKGWRKKTIQLIAHNQPKNILDIATGTGDFAIEAMKLNPDRVIGVDISEGMLKLGIEKIKRLNLQDKVDLKLGDSENLPFDNNSFDAVTVGFGVRNFEHLEKGIHEIYRVINHGGTFAVLEFSKPKNFPIKQLYNFYFKYITPAVGKLFSKDASAYTYLPESVKAFPDGEAFLTILRKAGFKDCKSIPVTFGIASIYIGTKIKYISDIYVTNNDFEKGILHILTIAFVLLSIVSYSQEAGERGNLSNYYNEKLHFGFTIGVNRTNFIIQNAQHFERFDSLKWIHSTPKTGFNLGIVSELRLHKYLTLRFIPSLSFAERNLEYYFEGVDTIARKKTIESTFLNFPLDLKLRSKRVGNFGAYILGGWSYSLDLASKRKTQTSTDPNEQIVKLKRDDFGYEVGAGAEFYLQYFKFAIEAKLSVGTKNLLIKDNTIYSNSIDKLNSKVFLISLTFEG